MTLGGDVVLVHDILQLHCQQIFGCDYTIKWEIFKGENFRGWL